MEMVAGGTAQKRKKLDLPQLQLPEKPPLRVSKRMHPDYYLSIKQQIIEAGYRQDVEWATNLTPCQNALDFFIEYSFVVVNSGMKAQIARPIFERILGALGDRRPISEVFGHKGKVAAINHVWENQKEVFRSYTEAEDKLTFLEGLPWIGKITKYHLAKNLGADVCKPDRHLVRVANFYQTTPEELCQNISEKTGDSVALIDLVIWRACNLGFIDSKNLNLAN
jgi:hypothetical protein